MSSQPCHRSGSRLRISLVILLLLWSLAPMLWQLYSSLRTPESLLAGVAGLGGGWTLINYTAVLQANPPFWRYLLNSSVVGALSTLLTLALAIPCAYSLSRRGGLLKVVVNNNDTIIMKGYAEKDGVRVGFGECRTTVLPAKEF